jgi:FAD/FMN-containing dehydrogenase
MECQRVIIVLMPDIKTETHSKLEETLKKVFHGDIDTSSKTREDYSHDASIFELTPEIVLYPKNSNDIKTLVTLVTKLKSTHPGLSLTPRSAGTDMSGGAITDSWLLDMTRYFNRTGKVTHSSANVQPGVYYRDFEPLIVKHSAQLGAVPASRALCTLGGMVANNSGGERSLQFGNAENYVKGLKVVLADSNEYEIGPIDRKEFETKMSQSDFEGYVYREIYGLIESDYEHIKNARPKTNKNSMGYNLWAVWDRETGIFDLTKLFTGSQGTLGIITDITLSLVPKPKHTGLLIAKLHDMEHLDGVINDVLEQKPAIFDGFDNITYDLALSYPDVFKSRVKDPETFKELAASFKGDREKYGKDLPKIVLLIEFEGDSEAEIKKYIHETASALDKYDVELDGRNKQFEYDKYWLIRRASFDLLRQRAGDKFASPFMDDVAVRPEFLSKFLPGLYKIIEKYELPATVAGHFGDGNFHIIPVMEITDPKIQKIIEPAMDEITKLVLHYEGTLAGEHNDGMIRGPWLGDVFGARMLRHFNHVKAIFDPNHIFNPHKKTDATWEFSYKHIRTSHEGEYIK